MKKIFLFLAFAFMAACQESLEERAAREARVMTETKCPMPIGDNLFLDSVVFDIPSLTQSQYFRAIGELDNDSVFNDSVFNRSAVRRHIDLRALLLNELKNSPSYKPLMDRGVNFHYVYRSATNPDTIRFELTLMPEDYK